MVNYIMELKTELILNYIKENGHTKTSFCKLCGIGTQLLNKILKKQMNYKINALFKIAKVLKINVCELFSN